ncbi:uncharacterized protein LOC120555386 isoform X3 [Perca fluviatilis]|uniref:uncharacterized protein LOC120555386 isoform X3 n=1 Tax=Perca fluviatilis TaxID=8168 RepID=UPI0019654FE8|nr:uncharacterized protein LOC120555386 isoform X3 [Perca fluviatilis]
MEVAPCVQKANSRAASLLASLNLQRGRAQFCDCVVRQRQNLSQLHPAHRCVLAASSPVLASILSSSGALVELQAPCLSDSVLPPTLGKMFPLHSAPPHPLPLPRIHAVEQCLSFVTAVEQLCSIWQKCLQCLLTIQYPRPHAAPTGPLTHHQEAQTVTALLKTAAGEVQTAIDTKIPNFEAPADTKVMTRVTSATVSSFMIIVA